MSSTSITDERTKKTIIAFTNIIRDELITTTDDIKANALREMGIRIQTDLELLNRLLNLMDLFWN